MNTDELTNVYERVGELVGNTNLPRHEEQLIIEFKKLQDHFNLLIELIQGVESEEQLKQLKQLPLLVWVAPPAPRSLWQTLSNKYFI